MNKILFILIPAILVFTGCTKKYKETSWDLLSPSGQLKLRIETGTAEQEGKLFYSVYFTGNGNEIPAIHRSPLGIAHSGSDFTEDLEAVGSSLTHPQNFSYTMLTGKRKINKGTANCMEIEFVNDKGDTMMLKTMAFNEGVAFAYAIPGKGETVDITDEITGFNIGPAAKAWIQPYDTVRRFTPAYEAGYINEMISGTRSPSPAGWGFPALFNSNGLWILISEAGLDENYCGVHLDPVCDNGEYKVLYPNPKESFGAGSVYPVSKTPFQTPWRFILAGSTLAPVVESNITFHLSEPSRIDDLSWIKPGRASWSWWSDHDSGKNPGVLKSFVDLAVFMGWEYSLVDANWDLMEGGTVEDVIKYANSKNIGILLWYNSGGPHNDVTERPRDRMYDPVIRNAEMERISKLGVKGIKVDFWQSDKQNIIKLYMDVAKDAARYKLLLNTHGCTIPRGWAKTFPNFVSMEGVNGAESYTFSDFSKIALIQNTIYPFTRNVIGSMDYTPVTFTDYSEKYVHLTSYGHELALSIVFESGIVHFADRVSGYRNLPSNVIEFLRAVPVTWDDTWFIEGYPGKYVVIARKNGDTYYIAGITSEESGRKIELNPGFLEEGTYSARLISDGASERSFDIRDFTYSRGNSIPANMGRYGGFVLTLKKK